MRDKKVVRFLVAGAVIATVLFFMATEAAGGGQLFFETWPEQGQTVRDDGLLQKIFINPEPNGLIKIKLVVAIAHPISKTIIGYCYINESAVVAYYVLEENGFYVALFKNK